MDPMEPTLPVTGGWPSVEHGKLLMDLSGQTLGEFHLIRRLGEGGMGQVYLAEQQSLSRCVAVKVMRPGTGDEVSFRRFKAEAEVIARITHPNIVQVYAFGETAGLHYMALELVEGLNLREYLSKKGPPDVPLALSIMRQVAAALQRAAELGIVHRDIKPENILLTRRGEVKVADFGLSRTLGEGTPPLNLTQPGMTLGTPLYMSPEQIQGLAVDPRTDIYSFGVTCYHMLTGKPPFHGQTALELALKHIQQDPPPLATVRPDLPAELCAVIHKMMAKDPAQRYQKAAELRKDLDQLRTRLAGEKTRGVSNTPTQLAQVGSSPTTPSRAQLSQGRLLGAMVVTVLLSLLGGASVAWLRNRASASSPPPATAEPGDSPLVTEQDKHERFLINAVAEYANPAADRDKLEVGLRHNLELGLFYLQQQRLDTAEHFFQGLIENSFKVEAYRTLGRIGQAIVLARQDRPEESNKQFLELRRLSQRTGRVPDRLPFLLRSGPLRYETAKALEYNRSNATKNAPFPTELEPWRKPPEWHGVTRR
jgi:serine/threonine-protein kinase